MFVGNWKTENKLLLSITNIKQNITTSIDDNL